MLIGSKQKLSTFSRSPSITIDGGSINQVVSLKSLRVSIQMKTCRGAYTVLKFLERSLVVLIIVALFEGIATKLLPLTKLQKLQNRAGRILAFSPYDANVHDLFKILGWKNQDVQRKIQFDEKVPLLCIFHRKWYFFHIPTERLLLYFSLEKPFKILG